MPGLCYRVGVVAAAVVAVFVGTLLASRPRCTDFYRVLALPRTAATAEVRKAWHRESLIHHPDKQRWVQRCKMLDVNPSLSQNV